MPADFQFVTNSFHLHSSQLAVQHFVGNSRTVLLS